MNKNLPLISVVVTTKNEGKNIERCLKSIKKQTYPQNRMEIIVVDNNSTDRTKMIAKKCTDLVYNFGPERSAQRNFGAKKAKGKYFMYLDADMILSPTVIKECVNKFKNLKLIGLYIPEIILGKSFWSKVRRFERSFYNATVIDCVRIVKSTYFKKVGGFDETMSGPEDWDFDKKIRRIGKVDIIASPMYHNEAEFNLKNYLNKKTYYIKSFKRYMNKWGEDDPDVKKQFGAWYRLIGVFTENNKWKKIIVSPHLMISLLFLRFLVGIRYIMTR